MLKREIRILGLSAPSTLPRKIAGVPIVGVVFRGNLWLDGMFTSVLNTHCPEFLSTLARTITLSKQYSQIRAAILPRTQLIPGVGVDIAALARKVSLPVIAIDRRASEQTEKQPAEPALRCQIKIRGKPISIWVAGTSQERASEIFNVGCVEGHRVPEAVRVAELVAKSLRPSFFKVAK